MTLALCAILALSPRATDVVLKAEQVELACASVPWGAAESCEVVLATTWNIETGGTLAWPRGGFGCGPGQVLETKNTPTCRDMREPVVGLRMAAWVWLKKRAGVRSTARAFRDYNGAAHAESYGRRAVARYERAMEVCR